MASLEAVELINHLSRLLAQREYRALPGQPGRKAKWTRKYAPAELAEYIDRHAYQFHARRLSDAGYRLVTKRNRAP